MTRPMLLGCAAVSYLSLIPIFAVGYYFLPEDSFYYATAKYDHAIVRDRRQIIDGLSASVQSQLHLPHKVRDGMIIKHVWVTNYRVPDDISSSAPAMLELNIEFQSPSLSGETHADAVLYTASVTNSSTNIVTSFVTMSPQILFNKRTIESNEIFTHGIISYPRPLRLAMIEYRKAYAGFPTYSSSDQFGRMLYLSATTITTLGYGDIQPLIPKARTLTALEAVSGIVIIGLFLNALSTQPKCERGI